MGSYNLIYKVLLFLTSLSLSIAARPINVLNPVNYVDDAITGIIDISSLAAIKSGGGPSPGGKGHEFPTANYFGNIKKSGPSPGGKGHEFTNDKILGNIKNSGPSPGGKGHGFHYEFPRSVETLGNILNSGPLWDLKNSGPSHGGEGH